MVPVQSVQCPFTSRALSGSGFLQRSRGQILARGAPTFPPPPFFNNRRYFPSMTHCLLFALFSLFLYLRLTNGAINDT